MTNEELQALPDGKIVTRTTRLGKKTEWIKVRAGREPNWAWFRRVLKDGSIIALDAILHADQIEVKP